MKVGNIIEEGRFGGPQNRILEVARRLKKFDIDTVVIFPKYQSSMFKQRLESYNIENIQLHLHRLTRDKKHLLAFCLFFPIETYRLFNLFKKERFDVVHCSGGAWQFKGIIAGRLAGIKVLWHLNDAGMPGLLRWLFRILAPKFTHGLIVSGQRTKAVYVERYGISGLSVMECLPPVDTERFDPQKASPDPIIEAANGLKVVTVANINPNKGLDIFIRMAALLNGQYDNLSFFIVGPVYDTQKQYANMLFRLKEDLGLNNLHFYGPCQDVPSVLKAADVFVCSSFSESGPMSVWEAMSMEKAIVSTDVGEVSRFLESQTKGFVVPIKNVDMLTDRVGQLIENADLREAFGKKARIAAMDMLDVRIAAQRHAEAYQMVTSF